MPGDDGRRQARRLTTRGAATRARIIEAAAELMHARSVASTTLDDVMAASGTGKSQFYQYFTDKEALVRDVVNLRASQVLERERRYLERLDSFRGLERGVTLSCNGSLYDTAHWVASSDLSRANSPIRTRTYG